jgi:hypothetical protein
MTKNPLRALNRTDLIQIVACSLVFWIFISGLITYGVGNKETYTAGDWLINYQGGFVRRGLIGQLIFWMSGNHSNTLWVTFAIQALIVLFSSWLILKIYFSSSKGLNWLIVLFSPAFVFLFFYYDSHSALRKEILPFLVMASLVYGLIGDKLKIAYLRFSVLMYFIAVFSHELSSLCIPFFLYPLYVQYQHSKFDKKALVRYGAYFVLISASGLILSALFKGNSDTLQQICSSLTGRGFDKAICGGSMSYLSKDLNDAVTSIIWDINRQPYLILFPILLFLSLIPFTLSDWFTKRAPLVLAITGFIFLLPLFITGYDWGRWIRIYITLLTLCLLFDSAMGTVRLRNIPKVFIVLFIFCWTLPAWFYKPAGILEGYSAYFPRLGYLETLYPKVWPATANPKLKEIEGDEQFQKELSTIFKHYKGIHFYPLAKNSDIQKVISRIAFHADLKINASKLNVISSALYFTAQSDEQITRENQDSANQLLTKSLGKDTLYVIPVGSPQISQILPAIDRTNDLIVQVGNFYLIAPQWSSLCKGCAPLNPKYIQAVDLNHLTLKNGEALSFAASNQGKNILLLAGWQPFAEDWGVWSDGNTASLIIPKPTEHSSALELNLRAFIAGPNPTLPIEVKINGDQIHRFILESVDNNRLVLPLTNSDQSKPFTLLEFVISRPQKPSDLGMGTDNRLLGIGLKSIEYRR